MKPTRNVSPSSLRLGDDWKDGEALNGIVRILEPLTWLDIPNIPESSRMRSWQFAYLSAPMLYDDMVTVLPLPERTMGRKKIGGWYQIRYFGQNMGPVYTLTEIAERADHAMMQQARARTRRKVRRTVTVRESTPGETGYLWTTTKNGLTFPVPLAGVRGDIGANEKGVLTLEQSGLRVFARSLQPARAVRSDST